MGFQDQSQSVHHAAGDRRHVRRRHLDPLDRDRRRHGDPGKGRQRLRRRGRDRVHACRWSSRISTGRAATCRSFCTTCAAASPEVICGQGPAPAAATIAHYRGLGLDMVPGTGLLAACVPGMFDTWMLLLRDYGTMHLADVLTPAIAYARNGHPFLERASATIAMVENLFREHWPTSAAVYLPGGHVPAPGTMFTNRRLAETYARVLREAESAGGDRVKQIERARKTWSQGLRRRGDRQILPHARRHGCHRRAPPRRAHRRRHGALASACRGAARRYDYGRLHGVQGRRLEPGSGDACSNWRCCKATISTVSIRPGPNSSICRSNAPSSPMPTARRSTAIPISSKCRSRPCCRMPTTPSAAS